MPASAGDPAVPDLIYDSATGEILLDIDGAVGLRGYVLDSAGGFLGTPGSHTPIIAGVSTAIPTQIAEAGFATPAGPWPKSIGFLFPTGMNLAGLSSFLTNQFVDTELGAPLIPFDYVVLNPPPPGVPEPSTYVLAAIGLIGLRLLGRRRRQA